tara:strand:- start:912 stop:1193 length:282 start_codon:yes stop_codon:yes gene_type:complete
MIDSPINTYQQLMIITAEECGELTQRCSKMLRKYKNISDIEEDQRIKFVEEVGDVFCMIELMVGHEITNWREIHDRADVKKDKLKLWSNLIHG